MLYRAVFTLAYQSGTRQNDAQHGDIVHHLHDAAEPSVVQSGVKTRPQSQLHRQAAVAAVALAEFGHLGIDDLLYRTAARKSLTHARGIHIQLHTGRLTRHHIGL